MSKEYYQLSAEETQMAINQSLEPLTDEAIRERQAKYGPNALVEGEKKSTLRIFAEQFKDFLVIILIIAAIISAFLGNGESAAVILIVITINGILGTVQTVKAAQSLDSLKQMSAPEAKVHRHGSVIPVPSSEVTVGDIVSLEAGDYIPADGRLIECASLKTDESALTGESVSVEKDVAAIGGQAALGDRKNMVYSGSFVTYGRAAYIVTGIGMETEVGKIAGMLKSASEKKTPLQVSLDQFGRKLSILILVFCGILFGVNVFQGGSIADAFLFAVALAVAAIPEALSSIVTIVLSFGTQKMARENAIIRKLQAVEGLGSVSVICSDKTGTLTQNKMTVEQYYVGGKVIPAQDVDPDRPEEGRLMLYSVLCNDSVITDDVEVGDPTETALVSLAEKKGWHTEEVRRRIPREGENPFDSDRKLMSVKCTVEGRTILIVKGAVDVLLGRMDRVEKAGQTAALAEEDKRRIEEQNEAFSASGLRVLAFGYKEIEKDREVGLDDEDGLIFAGLIAMMDPPRKESMDAVAACKRAGIRPVMITGDHKVTASAIARRIGILDEGRKACEGADIDAMSDEELKDFVDEVAVYARVSPEHKIRIVRAWQERGNIVAMTGDGVNDAPALKQADIGVAMGITGSEVAKDAAAMVLTDDNFATIVKAVENGRKVYNTITHSIQFLLSGNFGAILAVLYASIAGLPVPFAPVHLLFINLLTDSLPAIALGLEPHDPAVMDDAPRPKNASILNRNFLTAIGLEGLCIGVTSMIGFYLGYQGGNSTLACTMAFGTLCTARLMHGFNSKSDRPVLFTKRFFNNKYLIGAFLLGLVLITLVMVCPPLKGIFQVQSLTLEQLLCVYGLAFVNIPVIQLMKAIRAKIKKS